MALIMRNAFHEGIVSSVEPSVIPEHSIANGHNVIADLSGILRIREGSRSMFPSLGNGNIQAMTYAFNAIYFVWNGYLYRYVINEQQPRRISEEPITTFTYDHVSFVHWTRSGKPVMYIFGGKKIYETDGETLKETEIYEPDSGEEPNMLQNEVGPHQAHYATLRASLSQRVAVAGLKESPNTVYLSAPLDITYFPLSQVIQLPDDGGKITGITNWYNHLIIFRDTDIWAFMGSDLTDEQASLVLQDGSVGCKAPHSITHVPEVGICFVGKDNIYALQGVSGIENQSRAVAIGNSIINKLREPIQSDESGEATGIYHQNEYIVSFPNSISKERVFRLTLRGEMSWYINSGPLSNHYISADNRLYGSYSERGLIHEITKDYLYDEDKRLQPSQFGFMFNELEYNEAKPSRIYDGSTGIPFSVTFRRENLQPGPARIKRIFLYVLSLGQKRKVNINHYGNTFNVGLFNTSDHSTVIADTTTPQDFNVTVLVDGNEIVVDNFQVSSKKLPVEIAERSEPIRIYEARIRPSLKAHYAQLRVESRSESELLALLGYGIDFQPKGRIRGIRNGVTNSKNW